MGILIIALLVLTAQGKGKPDSEVSSTTKEKGMHFFILSVLFTALKRTPWLSLPLEDHFVPPSSLPVPGSGSLPSRPDSYSIRSFCIHQQQVAPTAGRVFQTWDSAPLASEGLRDSPSFCLCIKLCEH